MSFKKARIISIMISLLGLAVAIIPFLISRDSSYVFIIVGFGVIAVGTIINIAFSRCPNCGRFVRVHSLSIPEYCPFCGGSLDSEGYDE